MLFMKPLCVMLLFIGLFSLVWLRSSVLKVAYELRDLEEMKMDALKDMKMLLAERAKLTSLERIDASFKTNRGNNNVFAENGFVFPDRINVVHVAKSKSSEPVQVSYERKGEKH